MNGSDLYYKKINQESTFLYDYCNSAIKKLTEDIRNTIPFRDDFKGVTIPRNKFLKEPVLKKLDDRFGIEFAWILIIEKNTVINFHIDSFRKSTVNMLLSSGISYSIFKKDIESNNKYRTKFEELVFEKKCFYLFNVSHPHSVVNLDKPRFMFSIKFRDGDLTYNEVFDWCKENNMLEPTQSK